MTLEEAVYDTIRWWGLFRRPVTAIEIWRSLVGYEGDEEISLREVQDVLANSDWLRDKVDKKWGYYYASPARPEIVDEYLRRHRLAQMKWKITRKVVKWLQYVPFARGIFGSGSLAVMNTRESSDLDLFVVVEGGRIWTARLLLLLVAQLTGKRRRYWDREAPDKVCLNHYVSDRKMLLPNEIHNLYTAMLYTHLVPIVDGEVGREFVKENSWIGKLVAGPTIPYLPSVLAVKNRGWLMTIRGFFERWLEEPIGDFFEKWAEKLQRWVIERHARPEQAGRVVLSNNELAFHPDSKVAGLLADYNKILTG